MGIGRFFRSIVNTEVLGEETIAAQEKSYRSAMAMYPNEDPHTLLARVWLMRMAARRTAANQSADMLTLLSMSETQQFACVPPPKNARALGLYFLYKERPDILQKHPKFQSEFEALMTPVFQAASNGTLEAVYRKHNPRVEWSFVEST